jgi:hypothetical protein
LQYLLTQQAKEPESTATMASRYPLTPPISPQSSRGSYGAASSSWDSSDYSLTPTSDASDIRQAKIDQHRAHKAQTKTQMKALSVMDQALHGGAAPAAAPSESHTLNIEQSGDKKPNAAEVRKAMIEKYRARKSQTKALSTLKEAVHAGAADKTRPRLEWKATTTRKIQKPDYVRDPETVAGMKCELDIEREMLATRKALKLVDYVQETAEGFQIIV